MSRPADGRNGSMLEYEPKPARRPVATPVVLGVVSLAAGAAVWSVSIAHDASGLRVPPATLMRWLAPGLAAVAAVAAVAGVVARILQPGGRAAVWGAVLGTLWLVATALARADL